MAASPTAPPSPATSADVIEVAAASSSNASPATTVNSTAPYGNGTVTVTKPCYGSGTGFLTLAKTTQTMSTYY
jgi:hypothetical protein